jgi:hypothetical protein
MLAPGQASAVVIPFDSPWRHGVYAFVVSPLLWLFASAVRVAIGALGGPQRWPVAIAAAAVGTAATAVSVLVALVVAVSLVVDARSNGAGPAWLPGQWLACWDWPTWRAPSSRSRTWSRSPGSATTPTVADTPRRGAEAADRAVGDATKP